MTKDKYIPALKFHWLTSMYDWLVRVLLPENKFKQSLIASASIKGGQAVLDFGTGTATLSIMAFQQQPEASYHGLDIDEKVLSIAKTKIEKSKSKISLHKYEGGKLPFSNDSFNRIISSLVMHHLTAEQKIEAFAEFKRVLAPDGEIFIADWGKPSNKLMRMSFHIVQLLDGYKTTNDNARGILPELMKEAGLKDIATIKHFNSILGTIELFKAGK